MGREFRDKDDPIPVSGPIAEPQESSDPDEYEDDTDEEEDESSDDEEEDE